MTQTSATARQEAGRSPDLAKNDETDDTADLDQMWSREVQEQPRRSFRSFVPLILCLLFGMEAGMGLGLLSQPQPVSTASIEVLPDPTLNGNVLDSSQANRFVQGQVLVLGSHDLQQTAQAATAGAQAADVTASQIGATDVVELRVTAATADDATALTQALIDAYRTARQQSFDQSADASIDIVNQQLKALQSASGSTTAQARNSQEYSRLLSLRNELQLNRDAAQLQVPVVQRPRPAEQSRWPVAARDAFIGLVLGGLLGLLLKMLLDRRPRRAGTTGAPPDWS